MVRITWDTEDPDYRWLEVAQVNRPRGWDRVRTALKALRGQEFVEYEVILNDKCIDSLKAFLEEV